MGHEREAMGFLGFCMCPGVACGGSACNWIVAYRGFFCTNDWSLSGTNFASPYWLHKDPCGMTTAFMTHFLIYGAVYIVNVHVLYPWFAFTPIGILHMFSFSCIMGLASISHWRAMTADPGAVPKDAQPLQDHLAALKASNRNMRRCHVSGIFKPLRAHYDREIQRCVVKMDHHCPWVNNCIGIANQKLFILFVGYVALGSFYALVLLVGRWLSCSGKIELRADFCDKVSPESRVMLILLTIEALVFGDADSYLNWLVPTVASWKDRDEIMGYTVPVKVEEEEALLSQDLEDPQIKNEPAGETDVEMNEMVEVSLASPKHAGPRERVTQKNEETQLRGDDAL